MNYQSVPAISAGPQSSIEAKLSPIPQQYFTVSFDFRVEFKTEAEANEFSRAIREAVFAENINLRQFSSYNSINYTNY